MTTDTQELLASYVRNGSEPAFRELVSRYVDLVYSTAVRLVDGDTHRAQDVAQIVFADLARMAGKLSEISTLGGWLHRHTGFVARTVMRGGRRRQARERKAAEMNALNDNSDTVMAQIAPVLDEAIQELGADDRDAILLRFFERRNLRSVGEALGLNENVAQKRVARAVQELGVLLQRRGVSLSAAALASCLAAGAVTAAPAGLGLCIAGSVFTSAGSAASSGLASTKVATIANLKVILLCAVVVSGLMIPLLLHNRAKPASTAETPPAQPVQAAPEPEAQAEPTPVSQDIPARAANAPQRPVRARAPETGKPLTEPLPPPPRKGAAAAERGQADTFFPPVGRFAAMSGSKVRIAGTSGIGDWQAESPLIGGFLQIGPGFSGGSEQAPEPGPVQAQAEAFVHVNSLTSVDKDGRHYSAAMDQVMHECLHGGEHPKIFYRLSDLSLRGATNYHDEFQYEFDSQGELAVAGTTNLISMPVLVQPLGQGKFMVSGGTSFKMTSFGVDPPALSAALGPLKAGDDVKLTFEWVAASKEAPSSSRVPLILKLPAAAFKGTPKGLPMGPNVEPLSDKPRRPLMVPPDLVNIAPRSKVFSSDSNLAAGSLAKLTDGDKSPSDQSIVFLRKGTQWVELDLGRRQEIFAIVLWHAHNVPKIYHDVIVQVSDAREFANNVGTLFNNDNDNSSGLGAGINREYVETYEGKLINANGIKPRYIRFYSKGSTESALNEYTEIEVYGRPAR